MNEALNILRDATRGSVYENRLFLVGGIVRDKIMGLAPGDDIDIVIEGDACELADFIFAAGVAEHSPVTYPRFGTAMLTIGGAQVEFVGARKESYSPESRKPDTSSGTLQDDILRRDFTINTLLENLHTGEIIDPIGLAKADIEARLIRAVRGPDITFADDPLRMLRAVRFAARFSFDIETSTNEGIRRNASRISIISQERIRDELIKMIMGKNAKFAFDAMHELGLLAIVLPEADAMHGVEQNNYHKFGLWEHTFRTLDGLPPDSGLELRLAALLHDIGKPQCRSVGADGNIKFYGHQDVGAQMAREALTRLKFPNDVIRSVVFLVQKHMRAGAYDDSWTDAAVRRLTRELAQHIDDILILTCADSVATDPDNPKFDACKLRLRIETSASDIRHGLTLPLTGGEIMSALGIAEGRRVGEVKKFLEEEIVEGRLSASDKQAAIALIIDKFW